MTGFPKYIAAAINRPKPSERCSDTTQSTQFVRASISSRLTVESKMRIEPLLHAFLRVSMYSAPARALFTLTINWQPESGPKAFPKARIAARGFFRSVTLNTSKAVRKRNLSVTRPKYSRSMPTGATGATEYGKQNTGIEALRPTAFLQKLLGVQISR